jgi:hypothetical protein
MVELLSTELKANSRTALVPVVAVFNASMSSDAIDELKQVWGFKTIQGLDKHNARYQYTSISVLKFFDPSIDWHRTRSAYLKFDNEQEARDNYVLVKLRQLNVCFAYRFTEADVVAIYRLYSHTQRLGQSLPKLIKDLERQSQLQAKSFNRDYKTGSSFANANEIASMKEKLLKDSSVIKDDVDRLFAVIKFE